MPESICFSVPFNGDVAGLGALRAAGATRFYGRASSIQTARAIVGAGRASTSLSDIAWDSLALAVRESRRLGADFEYLLNDPDPRGLEDDQDSRAMLVEQLRQIDAIGVASVKVAHPVVAELALRHTGMRVGVSKFARTRSPQQAQRWQEVGVHSICLEPAAVRDLPLLRAIRSSIDCELEVLANDACLAGCPYALAHASYSARSCHDDAAPSYTHYYSLRCLNAFLSQPDQLLRATFVRPEDVCAFRDAGVDSFKLTDRAMSTAWLVHVLQAYAGGSYSGNLADLFPLHSAWGMSVDVQSTDLQHWRERARSGDVSAVQEFRRVLPALVGAYIESSALGPLSNAVRHGSCSTSACGAVCQLCSDLSLRAVSFRGPLVEEALKLLSDLAS